MPKNAQPYHHGDLRAALITQAMAALDRDPDTQVTLRGLAKEVGVSAMAPYAHFDGKDALLDAVAIEGFAVLEATLTSVKMDTPADPAPRDILTDMARAYVGLGLERPGLYRTMFGRPAAPLGSEVRDAGERAFRPLLKLFAACDGDGRQSAEIAWSLIHGLTLLVSTGFLETGEALEDRILAACAALLPDRP